MDDELPPCIGVRMRRDFEAIFRRECATGLADRDEPIPEREATPPRYLANVRTKEHAR